MTINVGFSNIPKEMLGTMENFGEYKYVPWLCVLEKKMESFKIPPTNGMQYLHFYFCSFQQIDQNKVWVGIMWILMCHGRLTCIVNYWMMLLCMNTFTWLGVVWKTKGKNNFNFILGMLVFKRCNMELMNI
jgi:hypothetical protein